MKCIIYIVLLTSKVDKNIAHDFNRYSKTGNWSVPYLWFPNNCTVRCIVIYSIDKHVEYLGAELIYLSCYNGTSYGLGISISNMFTKLRDCVFCNDVKDIQSPQLTFQIETRLNKINNKKNIK